MGRRPLMSAPDQNGVVYEVRPGDTLTKIISDINQMSFADIRPQLNQVLEDNPHINNVDRIWPGQLIFVRYNSSVGRPISVAAKMDVAAASESFSSMSAEERATARMLSPLVNGPATVSKVFTDTFKDTIQRNQKVISDIIRDYEQYKAGQLTKNQYSYRRVKHLQAWKANTGPAGAIALGGKEASQSFRIQSGRSKTPTKPLLAQTKNLTTNVKLAKVGGNALTVVNLGIACRDIAHQTVRTQKNEILIETTGALAGGAVATAAIALAITPVGWVAILTVAAVGAVAGYGAGKASVAAYDRFGQKYDIVDVLQVESVCNTEMIPW